MTLPTRPPVELNEEQREAAEEAGLLDYLLGNTAELARVFVPRHPRIKEGRVEDVDPYSYERTPGVGEVMLNPPTKVRTTSRPLTDEEFTSKYGQARPKDGKGDCYIAAFQVMQEAADNGEDMDAYRYCVGVPKGAPDSEIEGVRFDHAWIERRKDIEVPPQLREQWKESGITDEQIDALATLTTVIDRSNGADHEGLAELYYAAGSIRQEDVVRYTWDEVEQLAAMNGWA